MLRALCGKYDMSPAEIFLILIPASLLFVLWLWFRTKEKPPITFLYLWGVLIFFLIIIGAFIWEPKNECTQFACALAPSSYIWFVGPVLALALKLKWNPLIMAVLVLLLPWVGIYSWFIIMIATNQVWGF